MHELCNAYTYGVYTAAYLRRASANSCPTANCSSELSLNEEYTQVEALFKLANVVCWVNFVSCMANTVGRITAVHRPIFAGPQSEPRHGTDRVTLLAVRERWS